MRWNISKRQVHVGRRGRRERGDPDPWTHPLNPAVEIPEVASSSSLTGHLAIVYMMEQPSIL